MVWREWNDLSEERIDSLKEGPWVCLFGRAYDCAGGEQLGNGWCFMICRVCGMGGISLHKTRKDQD